MCLRSMLVALLLSSSTALPVHAHGDAAAENKEVLTAFYNLIFRDHKPEEAFAKYAANSNGMA